jgi:hypothetical protein
MITAGELYVIKGRLMLAAEAAAQIARSDEPVTYDGETYQRVMQAMLLAAQDLHSLFAELDVLRAMYEADISKFLKEGIGEDAVSVADAGSDVAGDGDQATSSDSKGEPAEPAGTDGRVQKGRLPRKRTRRSKPRRDTAGDGGDSVGVGRAD